MLAREIIRLSDKRKMRTPASPWAAERKKAPYPHQSVSSRVMHEEWGEGLIQCYEGDKMVVLFDEVGYKTLGVQLVKERGLIEPID